MKKVMIGATILIAGVTQSIGIIMSGAIYLLHVTAWDTSYPSKLFFVIMAGNSHFEDGADGLGLGIFFVFGLAMILFGLVILIIEYLKREQERGNHGND